MKYTKTFFLSRCNLIINTRDSSIDYLYNYSQISFLKKLFLINDFQINKRKNIASVRSLEHFQRELRTIIVQRVLTSFEYR